MINVEQLTSQLRMLPDAALQRVAQMYKADPYIFPMVISEGMARKKLRAAGQAQAVAPQPKVADQAIMSMGEQPQPTPGIAGLQAPNMQNMADGGIAGQADDMEFAQRSEPVVRMNAGGVARYADEGLVRPKQGPYPGLAQYGDLATGQARAGTLLPTTTGYEGMSIGEFLSQAYDDVSNAVKKLYGKLPKESLAQVVAKDLAEKKQKATGVALAEEPPLINPETGKSYKMTAPAATPSATGLREPGEVAADTRTRTQATVRPTSAPAAAPVRAAPAPVASPAAIPTYAAPTPEASAAGIAALSKAPDEATKKAYQEMMGMYEPERKELEERRGKRGAEALLRAGLAMMSGTSPHAMTNIGKGGIEGLNAYQEAQRYDDQAAKALRQAEMSMRMAQRQEEAGNRRDAISLYGQAQQMQQAAASSAQQAQQIQQTGDYQRGSLAVMQQNAATNARLVGARIAAINAPQREREKMMAEYGKLQKTVMEQLGKDSAYTLETDPAKRQKLFDTAMKVAVAQNPFLSSTLFLGAPTGPVRDPYEEKATDTPD